MTHAECEIVANAGVQLREIAQRITVAADARIDDLSPNVLVHTMDAAALSISEVYGQLSALPLETEDDPPIQLLFAIETEGEAGA